MSDPATAPKPSFWELPEVPRALPFAAFLLIGSFAGAATEASAYWVYVLKTFVGAALLWHFRPRLAELRWAVSWEAVVVGVLIAALWIGLDGRIPALGTLYDTISSRFTGKPAEAPKPEAPWNPLAFFKDNAPLGYAILVVRVVGRSFVVPMVEELFYRSFFHRFIASQDFLGLPIGLWNLRAFVITSVAFGLAHPGQWVQGIVCGAAYQFLVIRHKRLGDSITAHAITNALCSAYAIAAGKWEFT